MPRADRSSGFRISPRGRPSRAFPRSGWAFRPKVPPVPGYGDGFATESHRVPGCPPGELCLAQAGALFKTALRHGVCNFPRVGKSLAILHGNCQGEHLAAIFRRCPDFDSRFELRVYVNYARQEIPAGDLERCALFLYQYLEPGWGELASDALLSRLPVGCASLCIPNIFFKGYWPLWAGKAGVEFRDIYLDHLLGLDLPPNDVLHLFLNTPLEKKYDLDALFAETVAIERGREAHTPVKYLDLILERFREERLMFTVNHPGARLLAHCALGILRELGLSAPNPLPVELDSYYTEFELPIHPHVARHHGFSHAGPDTLYNVFGLQKTFAQYARAYVEHHVAGFESLTGYLQLR